MGHRMKDKKYWWPNGIIYYDFILPDVSKLSQGQKTTWERYDIPKLIEGSMARWERYVNQHTGSDEKYVRHIQFKKKEDDNTKYKKINLTKTGSSGVGENGYAPDNEFVLDWPTEKVLASIPHEIGHLLGLTHEHDRNKHEEKSDDADAPRMVPSGLYVDGATFARKKSEPFGDYDVWSIMHYPVTIVKNVGSWDWNVSESYLNKWVTKHKDTVYAGSLTNYPSVNDVVGQVWSPSAGDIANLRDMYPVSST